MTNPFAESPRTARIAGEISSGWESVADLFARVVGAQGEGGAAVTVYERGVPVLDLVGGDYAADAIQMTFSVSKAVTAFALHHAAEQGLIDLERPLADYWPGFGKPSTRSITPLDVMSHRAGLAALDAELTLEEVLAGAAERLIAEQEPYWQPGTAHGYHSFTYGLILDGAFVRLTGRSLAEYVDTELRAPLGLDLWLGASPSELSRIHPPTAKSQWTTEQRMRHSATLTIPGGIGSVLRRQGRFLDHPDVLTAGWPAMGVIASARSLARLAASTLGEVDGVRLLSEPRRQAMVEVRSDGIDRVLGIHTRFGAGVQRPFPQFAMLSADSYGHEGANGAVMFADPRYEVAVGFTTSVYPEFSGMPQPFSSFIAGLRDHLDHSSIKKEHS